MILFLCGSDSYRAQQKLKEIRVKYQTMHPCPIQVRDFDCEERDIQEWKRFLETVSLFELKKLAIFRNPFGSKESEQFFYERREDFQVNKHYVIVLLQTQQIKEKSRNKLYQWLLKNTKHQEFLPLSGAKLVSWIEQECSRYHLDMTQLAKERLARSTGSNLWQLSQDIKKIAAWKKSEKDTRVKEADVALFISEPASADIFATIEAVARQNKKRALEFLYGHMSKGEAPAYLLSMLQYQFRVLLQIRDMLERKIPFLAMAQKTKLHPYILKKGLRVAESFSLQELKDIYEKLFLLDKNLKTGKIEPEGIFDTLIARL